MPARLRINKSGAQHIGQRQSVLVYLNDALECQIQQHELDEN